MQQADRVIAGKAPVGKSECKIASRWSEFSITAACPTAAGMGSPVQKAELGHHDYESYQQRATTIGQKVLKGGSNYPAPETDSVNGVTGTVQVTWNITRP